MRENLLENVEIEALVITTPDGQSTSDVDNRMKQNIPGGKQGEINNRRINKDEIEDRRISKEEINDRRISKEEINDRRINKKETNDRRINREEINDRRINKEEISDRRIYTNKEKYGYSKGQGLGKNSDGIKEPIRPKNSFFIKKKLKNLVAPVRPYNACTRSKQNQLPSPPTETTETEHLDETSATIPPPPKYTYLPSLSRERLLLSPFPSPPPPSRRQLPSSPPPPIQLTHIMPERAKVMNISRWKKLIALPANYPPNKQNLVNTLKSLYDVVTELEIKVISISKTQYMGDLPWRTIKKIIKEIFSEIELVVIVCNSLVQTPQENEIKDILEEYHLSPTGGHKGDCNLQQRRINSSNVYIQLLQAAEYMSMPVIQCKVVITRIVQYCGMHSHVSAVQGGLAEYLLEPTQRQCRNMHETGTLIAKMIADSIIRGFTLHSVYGCGMYLWGALWDALTHLLITISKKQQPPEVMGLRQKQIEPGPRPGESLIEMEPSTKLMCDRFLAFGIATQPIFSLLGLWDRFSKYGIASWLIGSLFGLCDRWAAFGIASRPMATIRV
ncbi:hypothetical protein M0802_014773 [Mischocyttarus mexicanus]|nr:hypothetical protein M0802_014773 [Mischocyttarus mexicanus]